MVPKCSEILIDNAPASNFPSPTTAQPTDGTLLMRVAADSAMISRIYDITWNEAGQKAGMPSSVFCKGTMDLNNRLQLSFGGSSSEVNFFNQIRPIVDYLAPEAWHAYIDPESCGSIIILKDLTDTADWCKYSPNITKDNVKEQFLTLAKLHGKFWESTDPLVEQFVPFALGFHAYCQSPSFPICFADWLLQRATPSLPA
jgi:hypothetical protein